jgi:hypothetical protein
MTAGQSGERAGDGATPSSDATDQGVLEAEQILCGAWEQVLLERREHMQGSLDAALECCATAYRQLVAAQRTGDPKAISSAHNTLERALDLARESSIACGQVWRASHGELRRISREAHEQAGADAAVPDPGGLVVSGGPADDVPEAVHQGVEVSAVEHVVRQVRRWLAQAVMCSRSLASKPATTRRTYL